MAQKRYNDSPLGSASTALAVTPHDSNEVTSNGTYPRALWVGGAGNLTVTMADGGDVLFSAVPAGTMLDIQVSHVKATGTAATNIVALF